MRNHVLKLILVFLTVVGVTYFILQYVFFNSQTQKDTKAAGEKVSLSFVPPSDNLTVNAETTTMIKLKPSELMLARGYLFRVVFNKNKVQIKDIDYKLGSASVGLGQDNGDLAAINNTGVIKIQGEINTAAGRSLLANVLVDVVSIKLKLKEAGAASLSIDKNTIKLVRIMPVMNLVFVPGAADVSFGINGGGGPATNAVSATLKLKLKFQAINKKPEAELNKLDVQVKLYNESSELSTDYKTAEFTANNDGIWSGEVKFNAKTNNKYIVVVKGPYHIAKKVCQEAPTESAGGTYHCASGKVTINAGVNNLNFSGITMLAGDLPVQDGAVTSYDISLVRNNLGKTDADSLKSSDLNLDGKVDTQDYAMIIAALSIKTDEL